MDRNNEVAVFGGGCFWCTEAIFQLLKGVISIMPGYAGGAAKNPTYERVCAGDTGHAEVIKIEFDPAVISYDDLLTVFFATHDPTTLNRQGADRGTQYRSIILYTNDAQKQTAETFIKKLNESESAGAPIATEVRALADFYEAENYHREYYRNNSAAPYCDIIINPKLKKVQDKFNQLVKK